MHPIAERCFSCTWSTDDQLGLLAMRMYEILPVHIWASSINGMTSWKRCFQAQNFVLALIFKVDQHLQFLADTVSSGGPSSRALKNGSSFLL